VSVSNACTTEHVYDVTLAFVCAFVIANMRNKAADGQYFIMALYTFFRISHLLIKLFADLENMCHLAKEFGPNLSSTGVQ
jgi:hypothetical protein